MLKNLRTYILPVIACVGLLLGIRTVVAGGTRPPAAAPVAEPARAPFSTYVAGAGIVEASTENIAIAAAVGGMVQEVLVVVGDQIKVGDILFVIDERSAKADLAVKTAALRVAEVRLADAQAQLKLMEGVSDRRALSVDELDRRRFGRATASAEVDSAQAQLDAASVELDRHIVRSPIDGEVLQVKVRSGEFASAQALANPLMIVGSVTPLNVRVDVDENDAWRVRSGAPAKASLRGNPEISVALKFVRFEPLVVPKRSLTGDSTERVDTRVLQILYSFDRGEKAIFAGQLMDVYIEEAQNSSM